MDFFIVGTSRTGSTLVRHMLAEHPDVGILNESHWVPTLHERFGEAPTPVTALLAVVTETHWDSGKRIADVTLELTGRTWAEMETALREGLGERATVDQFHDALFDAAHGVPAGRLRRGDKTPDYGFYLRLLQRIWPGARFVHVVRNGVDAARSMSLHSGCQRMICAGHDNWVPLSSDRQFETLEIRNLPYRDYLASWCRRMRRIREEAAGLQGDSYLELRYERLLEEPLPVLRRLAAHLDLPPNEEWLRRAASLVRPRGPGPPPPPGGLEELAPEDLGLVEAVGDAGSHRTVPAGHGQRLARMDETPISPEPGEILLFVCVRNEALRLPYFLEYYRNAGVSRFLVVDNDSSDGTAELLGEQPDVHRFWTRDSYAESHFGVHWLNALLDRYGSGHWVLVVDADELLVYPHCEDRDLPGLASELERSGADALLSFLLDMYADGPIRDAHYSAGTPFLATCRYFDSGAYTRGTEGLQARIPARGGVRRRVFWPPGRDRRGNPPYLPKIPLVRWRPGLEYVASTHLIHGLTLAPITGALLHFKLFSDFIERARLEVNRREHWDDAAQYSAYTEAFGEDLDLDPMYEGSLPYEGSRQLVELGLMLDGTDGDPVPPGGPEPGEGR